RSECFRQSERASQLNRRRESRSWDITPTKGGVIQTRNEKERITSRLSKALQRTAAPLCSRTVRENLLATITAYRAFPAAVAELGSFVANEKHSMSNLNDIEKELDEASSTFLVAFRLPKDLDASLGAKL